MEMPTAVYLIVGVVSGATLLLLGINIFLSIRAKKNNNDDGTVILHQRTEALSKAVSDQSEENKQLRAQLAVMVKDEKSD